MTDRRRMLASTKRRSRMEPVYGAPGVDSSMYRPYSGWKTGGTTLCFKMTLVEPREIYFCVHPRGTRLCDYVTSQSL